MDKSVLGQKTMLRRYEYHCRLKMIMPKIIITNKSSNIELSLLIEAEKQEAPRESPRHFCPSSGR